MATYNIFESDNNTDFVLIPLLLKTNNTKITFDNASALLTKTLSNNEFSDLTTTIKDELLETYTTLTSVDYGTYEDTENGGLIFTAEIPILEIKGNFISVEGLVYNLDSSLIDIYAQLDKLISVTKK